MNIKALLFAAVLLVTGSQHVSAQTIIGVWGDSTTQGWTVETGTATVTPRNEVAQLQTLLQAEGYNVKVENHGSFGATSFDLLNGTGNVPTSFAVAMATTDATFVVIDIGLNDTVPLTNGTEKGATYAANIQQLVNIAKAAGKTVFIETANPRTDSNGAYENQCMWIAVDNLSVYENTPGTHWIDVYTAITSFLPNWQNDLPDGIHPNDTMYAFKAAVEAGVIAPYLSLTYPIYTQIP